MLPAHRHRPLLSPASFRASFLAAFCTAAVTLTACSAGSGKPDTAAPATGAEHAGEHSASPTPDSPLGISSGGVTTRMEIPAESTEEQYAQACLTASDWMTGKGGDRHSLVEPYLKEIQASTEAGRATFGKTWSALSDPQRAGVIIAVRAAADGGC